MRLFAILVVLAGCAPPPVLTALPRLPTTAEQAFIEAAIGDAAWGDGPRRAEDVRIYSLADSLAACGTWQALSDRGGREAAPFYLRWQAGRVLRLHLDDATDFGPALLACNQLEGASLRVEG